MRFSAVLLSLFLPLLATAANADTLVWLESIEAGRAQAARTGKLLLVHFWSTHCGPCVQLDRKVYSQDQVAQSIERHFVPVKINTEVHPELARRHAIRFVPTDLVMDASGRILATQKCPPEPTRYLAGLMRLVPTANANRQAATAPTSEVKYENIVGSRYASSQTPPSVAAMPPQMSPQIPPQVPAFSPSSATPSVSPVNLQQPVQGPPSSSVARSSYAPAPSANVAQSLVPPTRTPPHTVMTPPKNEEPGLDGMCAVELTEHQKWVAGDRRWGAYHRGRLYLFAGELQQQRFLANPDHYSPVFSGYDPVVALKERRFVPGRRQHGAFYNRRVYLFASEASLAEFYQAPERFQSAATQAPVNR